MQRSSSNIALSALRQWGDEHADEKPPRVLRRKSDKKPVIAALVPAGSKDLLSARDVELVERS